MCWNTHQAPFSSLDESPVCTESSGYEHEQVPTGCAAVFAIATCLISDWVRSSACIILAQGQGMCNITSVIPRTLCVYRVNSQEQNYCMAQHSHGCMYKC